MGINAKMFPLNMYPILMLHFRHHKCTFQWSQTINRPQHIQNKLLIIFHIGSVNLQQIIITSRYVITFGYFRNILYDPCKLCRYIPVQTSKLHTAEHDKSLIQFLRIQYGNILLYITSIIKQSTMIIPGACDNSADSWNFIYPKQTPEC